MARGNFTISRQPGSQLGRGRKSGSRDLNNPRTLEAAIRTGEISKAEYENFAHRPRLERLLNSLRVYSDAWGPLVPVDQERREKACQYLRQQMEKTCELILTNRVEDEEFRLFDDDELLAEAPADREEDRTSV